MLVLLSILLAADALNAGNTSESVVRRAEPHAARVLSAAVLSQGAIQLDASNEGLAKGRVEKLGVTDPAFIKSAGKWKVHYSGWPTHHEPRRKYPVSFAFRDWTP
ncbi:unnamed protein product [Effrenium voratum]|nr:unnamed protein product [Effrenium voratum]